MTVSGSPVKSPPVDFAPESYDDLVIRCVEGYYADLGEGPLPSVEVAAAALFATIRSAVSLRNYCALREDKWPSPRNIPLLAVVLCAMRHIRFVNIVGEDGTKILAMYVDDPNCRDHGTYVTDEKRMRAIIRHIAPSISRNSAKEALAMLADWAPVVELEHDRDLIPVNNCIFDYRTKELLPFSPERVFLAKLPFDMPDHPIDEPKIVMADGRVWTPSGCLAEIIEGEDTREVLWDILGALLRPLVNWKRVCLWIGDGANGKGTVVELARALVGPGNWACISLKHFDKQTDLAPLLGKIANVCDENDESFIPSSELIKSIADQNAITVKRLYADPFTYRLRLLNIQCMNDLPTFKDKSFGMHRRISALPFKKQFIEGENDVKEIKEIYVKLPEVVQWVAYHALVERPAYYEIGRSAETDECLSMFRTETDPVRQFWQDEVMGGVLGCFLPYSFLHAWYTRWLRDVSPSSTAVSQRTLTRRIKDIAAADGWVDVGNNKRPIGGWCPVVEDAPKHYARMHWTGTRQDYDPADILGRWYAYGSRPASASISTGGSRVLAGQCSVRPRQRTSSVGVLRPRT